VIRNWLTDQRLGLSRRRKRRATGCSYLGDGVALCRVLDSFKMFVPTADMSLAPSLMLDGVWEIWVTRAMAERLRPGMAVADIGANLGYFTMLMAERVGAGGRVHAFEPNPALVTLIERSIAANGFGGRVAVDQLALGDEDGREMLLVVPGDYLGGAATWPVQPQDCPGSLPVVTRRLDSIDGAAELSLIKIDTEGFEEAIWDGMAGLVAGDRLRTVFLEFTAGHYRDPRSFLAKIAAAGFRLSIVDQSHGTRRTTADAVLALPADVGAMLILER
jgi:FkbM family methyltransferase